MVWNLSFLVWDNVHNVSSVWTIHKDCIWPPLFAVSLLRKFGSTLTSSALFFHNFPPSIISSAALLLKMCFWNLETHLLPSYKGARGEIKTLTIIQTIRQKIPYIPSGCWNIRPHFPNCPSTSSVARTEPLASCFYPQNTWSLPSEFRAVGDPFEQSQESPNNTIFCSPSIVEAVLSWILRLPVWKLQKPVYEMQNDRSRWWGGEL